MIEEKNFGREARRVMDWVEDYFRRLPSLPVKSTVKPGDIYSQIPAEAPLEGESMESIMGDLDKIIIPGMTHWQHPNFHAYFPANSSRESLLGEVVTAAMGAQCMVWETSPAAAELEERMMEWLSKAVGLPAGFTGVIQDSASSSTLTAILTAREKVTGFTSNETGVPQGLRVYCSAEAHSSVEKAVGICGIGRRNLVKIAVDGDMRMIPSELEKAIRDDKAAGLTPVCVVAAIGTTGTVSVDPLKEIAAICGREKVWLHVDAAYAGTALLLPEYRHICDGLEQADSLVINPHKWMFVNFDCSTYFVKDTASLIRTFDILPEYLKTATHGTVNDYRDWGIPLGRRFRALKLWFVMRSFGLEAMRKRLREHIALNEYFSEKIVASGKFVLAREPFLAFSCFTLSGAGEGAQADEANKKLLDKINSSGKAYLSHTRIGGRFVLRLHSGQTYITKEDIERTISLLLENA